MSVKKRSAGADYLGYLLVRILVCLVQALPFETACQFARLLGWIVYKLDRRHRQIAVENLRKAFPGLYNDVQIDTMVRGVYVHFFTVLIELMHIPRRFHLHNYKKSALVHEPERLADAYLTGRPLLFVTGHFGNWEMGGYHLGLAGFQSHAIARPLDNPYLDQFLRSFRERTGQKLLAKHGDFANIEKHLKAGGIIATMADQDAGPRGMFVNFFGRPASTHKAIALLALEHNVPMVVLGVPKLNGRYCIQAVDVIYPEDYDKSPDAVRAITQRFTTGLETLIRQAPEQYFWVHRRWKHAPAERRKKGPKPLLAKTFAIMKDEPRIPLPLVSA